MSHLEEQNAVDSQWPVCEPGTLSSFAAREKSHQLRRRLAVLGGGSALSLLALLFLFAVTSQWSAPTDQGADTEFGGIACAVVHDNIQSYHAGTLDAQMQARISRHLRDCKNCRAQWPELAMQTAQRMARPLAFTGMPAWAFP